MTTPHQLNKFDKRRLDLKKKTNKAVNQYKDDTSLKCGGKIRFYIYFLNSNNKKIHTRCKIFEQ